MSNIHDILKGHLNELLDINSDLYNERVKLCEQCPLYLNKYGGYCNPKIWYNPDTGQTSDIEMIGWVRGCGCRIRAKARLEDNHCVLNKW